jgi:hypothetical protein
MGPNLSYICFCKWFATKLALFGLRFIDPVVGKTS